MAIHKDLHNRPHACDTNTHANTCMHTQTQTHACIEAHTTHRHAHIHVQAHTHRWRQQKEIGWEGLIYEASTRFEGKGLGGFKVRGTLVIILYCFALLRSFAVHVHVIPESGTLAPVAGGHLQYNVCYAVVCSNLSRLSSLRITHSI